MQQIRIQGGRALTGTVQPPAAKNSVLPLLAASLLCSGRSVFRQVPQLSDVDTSLALLRAVGVEAVRQGSDLLVPAVPDAALNGAIPPVLAGAMRSSVFYLAPLLCRVGWVRLPLPGGCRLGPRPIDIHLAGLTAMGAVVHADADSVTLRRAGPLRGVDFTLRMPSVGATVTLMLAACCAAGTTVLRGVAAEPEITDVANYLRACGAHISGAGGSVMVIRGAAPLDGAAYTPMPDRIAVDTYAAAVACAGGELTVQGCCPAHQASFLHFLRAVGCEVSVWQEGFLLRRDKTVPLRGNQEIVASAWPGFATDAAPLAAAVLLTADGPSVLYDNLFQNRFACAEGFRAMGASCTAEGRRLRIGGGAKLHGAPVFAPDLRGGAALLVAALSAEGTTILRDSGHIRRGYADLPGTLAALGADCRPMK